MELKLTIELLHGDMAESQAFRVSNPAEPGDGEAAVKLVEALTRLVNFEEVMVALHNEMAWKYENAKEAGGEEAQAEEAEDVSPLDEVHSDEEQQAHDNRNLAGAEGPV